MEAPLALYRRYRPDTFAQVIGQDHVTEPLRAALRNNRVNHAYLFSGPRGCGKTTSARILARALNCAQGPTEEPCGSCDSCVELATGGPGSVDVIEIDAASHGGVDDARELREQATFRPMRDRYKIYIIDEAHMVTPQGFNALLKIVEEPPEHVRFIFATTEPEKVIGTVRSRTHHYPFRLIPPRVLSDYLAELCRREGVEVEPAALPLIVRAGGGSARDTLSVLDQLIGGAAAGTVTYDLTVGLLGFTPDSLLDEVIDAFAGHDGAAVFAAVDRVIETGQDPRRFTEDLLRRLRDLVIIAEVPDAPAMGLIDAPEDQAERLVAQAARFGRHDLARAADLVATGLTDLKGTTAPRLLLELLCARILLPGAEDSAEGLAARIDRLEKRMSMAPPTSVTSTPVPAAAPTRPAAPPASAEAARTAPPQPTASATPPAAPTAEPGAPAATPSVPAAPAAAPAAGSGWSTPPPQTPSAPPQTPSDPAERTPSGPPPGHPGAGQATAERTPTPAPDVVAAPGGAAGAPPAGGLTLADVRRLWPEIIEAVKSKRRVTWIVLSQNAQAVALEARTLTLGFNNAGARDSFVNSRSDEIVRQVLIDLIGQDWKVEAIIDPSAQPGAEPHRVTRASVSPAGSPAGPPAGPPAAAPAGPPANSLPAMGSVASPPEEAAAAPATAPPVAPHRPEGAASQSAREAIRTTRQAGPPAAAEQGPVDEDAHPDDPTVEETLDSAALLAQRLGAQVIEEIPNG